MQNFLVAFSICLHCLIALIISDFLLSQIITELSLNFRCSELQKIQRCYIKGIDGLLYDEHSDVLFYFSKSIDTTNPIFEELMAIK